MPLPDDNIEECLARARYARDRAEQAKTAEDKESWLRIAAEWQDLAIYRGTGTRKKGAE
jgi:hypothetical protein